MFHTERQVELTHIANVARVQVWPPDGRVSNQ